MKPSPFLTLAAFASMGLAAPAWSDAVPGRAVPAFVGPSLDGATVDLGALRGKVVVVHLWATWCPPCRAEMPALDAFARAHPHDVAVVALSADTRRDLGRARQIMAQYSYPAALMEAAKVDGFGEPRSLPVTYMVDRRGVIRDVFTPREGLLTREKLDAALGALQP